MKSGLQDDDKVGTTRLLASRRYGWTQSNVHLRANGHVDGGRYGVEMWRGGGTVRRQPVGAGLRVRVRGRAETVVERQVFKAVRRRTANFGRWSVRGPEVCVLLCSSSQFSVQVATSRSWLSQHITRNLLELARWGKILDMSLGTRFDISCLS
jgi:hypothetical protein